MTHYRREENMTRVKPSRLSNARRQVTKCRRTRASNYPNDPQRPQKKPHKYQTTPISCVFDNFFVIFHLWVTFILFLSVYLSSFVLAKSGTVQYCPWQNDVVELHFSCRLKALFCVCERGRGVKNISN